MPNTENKTLPAVVLLVDSCHGVYIPQRFATNYDMGQWEVSDDQKECLLTGPDNPDNGYWDEWDIVLSNASYTKDGNKWTLYQDGDLWALCVELMTDEEKANFGMEEYSSEE
jgi:hypothetical protein